MQYNKKTMSIAEKQALEVAGMAIETINATASIAFVVMAENGTIDEITAGEHMSIFAPWEPNVDYVPGLSCRWWRSEAL